MKDTIGNLGIHMYTEEENECVELFTMRFCFIIQTQEAHGVLGVIMFVGDVKWVWENGPRKGKTGVRFLLKLVNNISN